jgi:hypothetical protein
MASVTKLSVSVPTRVWQEVVRLVGRPGETRSALVTRVLDQALRAARDAEITAEYARAYAQQPESDEENALHRALLDSTRRRFEELDREEAGEQTKGESPHAREAGGDATR